MVPELDISVVSTFYWNVNGRWPMIDTSFMHDSYDIVFISETHCNGSLLKSVNGFNIVSDPNFKSNTHGGLAAYISVKLYPYITNIRFSKCSLSFSFTTLPGFCFIGVYMYPIDSMNFELDDFGLLSEDILFWLNKDFVPFVGGDFNSRLGDINSLAKNLAFSMSQ